MGLALEDKWLWDSWYIHDGTRFHGFFLQAPKSIGDPELRHWNVSIGHAISDDLQLWQYLGTCFGPGAGPAWDDCTTWTGSVIQGPNDIWHLFYTGTSKAEQGLKQRIGHATSMDLHHWQRVGDGLVLDIAAPYEEHIPGHWHDRAFRDPWVFADPDGQGWLMAFTARDARETDRLKAGCIGLARSQDLMEWQLEEPVFTGACGELEVPQLFAHNGTWYCLFCTSARFWSTDMARLGAPQTGTHYLTAPHPRGPWQIGEAPVLDGAPFAKRYAARILPHNGGLSLLGFRWFDHEGGPFIGQISDPERIHVTQDNRLIRASMITSGEE